MSFENDLHIILDALPAAPFGDHKVDYALNILPEKAFSGHLPYWSALLALLHAIDCLVHPLATIASNPDSGSSWYLKKLT